MSREYREIPTSMFINEEWGRNTTLEFEKVFNQPIGKKCINLMLDYTENYITMYHRQPEIERSKYVDTITKDKKILKEISAGDVNTFSIDELLAKGISLCTIKTGLQRLWINYIKTIVNRYTQPRKSSDFKKFKLLPGQHIFYYGAFSGRVTRSMSTATHHFVYLYNGIIMEVGTQLVDGCLDADENPELGSLSMVGKIKQYLYKGAMSYFGFSTIQESVTWATSYGQDTFYVYDMHNDADIKVIKNRLSRASSIIGKWPYSLLGSNNCENAANYIYVGESLSTQACALDTFSSITQSLKIVPEIDYTRTYEYDLRSKAEIPNCVRNKDVYTERYITEKGQICKGGLNRGLGILNPTCKIDPRYCTSCEETGKVTYDKPRKVCLDKKANGFKILM